MDQLCLAELRPSAAVALPACHVRAQGAGLKAPMNHRRYDCCSLTVTWTNRQGSHPADPTDEQHRVHTGCPGMIERPHHELVERQRLLIDRATGTPLWSNSLRTLLVRRQLLESHHR